MEDVIHDSAAPIIVISTRLGLIRKVSALLFHIDVDHHRAVFDMVVHSLGHNIFATLAAGNATVWKYFLIHYNQLLFLQMMN